MKLIRTSLLAFAILLTAGCAKEYDDSALFERIEDLEAQAENNANAIKRLKKKLNQAVEQGMQLTVQEVSGGYTLTFSDGSSITINHGQNGAAGNRGPQGPQGTAGEDGECTLVSITETADGTAWVIKLTDGEYTISKGVGNTFSFKLNTTEMSLAPGESQDISYTLSGADATTGVYVRVASGYTATVDQINNKVTITAPEGDLPIDGFVVFTAVKTSTGEVSSQYVSFVSGSLTVVADAEEVAAAGGVVTLTVNANCSYEVVIPSDCTWIRRVETRADMQTTYVYIEVDANTSTDPRTATVSLRSTAGLKTVVIAQKGVKVVDPNAFNIYPDDAAEKIAAIAAMTAGELDGQTINFTAGDYTSEVMNQLTINAEQVISLTITGDGANFSTGGTVFSFKNVNATFDGLTFNGCRRAISLKSGNTTITDCTFTNNTNSNSQGGAIFMDGEAKATISNCTFNGNKARYGADVYMVDGDLTMVGCSFTGSEGALGGSCLAMSAQYNSSGLYNSSFSKSKALVKNCTFSGIKAGLEQSSQDDGHSDAPGGVLACVVGDLTVEGCTFDSCSGYGGTVVSLGSRVSRYQLMFGNAFLKMNNCIIKNCSIYRLGLIYLNGKEHDWTADPTYRGIAFINNTSFVNNSSTTGDFGIIAHSGGSAGIIMLNNCTSYANNINSGNGIAVNNNGFVFVSNSTFVTDTKSGFFRSAYDNQKGSATVINTIAINTKEGEGLASIRCETGAPFVTDGHCIYGPEHSSTSSLNDPIKNATTASLSGYSWNENTNLVEWNGPAANFSKLSASDFQNYFTDFGIATSAIYNESTAGAAFYNWLVSINAVGKDARGNDRGSSWWPGAYQN